MEWQNKPTKAIELKANKIFSNKQEEKVVEDISDKRFINRYERYEWHLKNGFSNDKTTLTVLFKATAASFNSYKLEF